MAKELTSFEKFERGLGIAGTGLAIFSGISSLLGQVSGHGRRRRAAKETIKGIESQAVGTVEDLVEQAKRVLGSQRAVLGATNVDLASGSGALFQQETRTRAKTDIGRILEQAEAQILATGEAGGLKKTHKKAAAKVGRLMGRFGGLLTGL